MLILLAFSFIVGLAVGSFINVLIDRLPRGDSPISPPSHCKDCGHILTPLDLIPLLSFFILHGRCRYCRAPIPRRLPLVELLTGISFAALAVFYGWSLELLRGILIISFLIPIAFIDLEHYIIPDELVYPLALLGLLFSPLGIGPLLTLLGAAFGFVTLLLPYLIYRKGLGGGDVKLSGALGAVLGFPHIFLCLTAAFVWGSIVAVVLLILRRRSRHDPLPFAPFLCAGALFTLLYGEQILAWYLSKLP